MKESYRTYEWVMSHICISMSHIWMSHVTHMNESCHTYERVMSHIWMSHDTCVRDLESDGASSHAVEGIPTAIWKRKRDLRDAIHVKRALYACQKSPICMSKEPYMHVKRALQGGLWTRPYCDTQCHLEIANLALGMYNRCQKSPISMSNELYMAKEPFKEAYERSIYYHLKTTEQSAACNQCQKSRMFMWNKPYVYGERALHQNRWKRP